MHAYAVYLPAAQSRYDTLAALVRPIDARIEEAKARPEAVAKVPPLTAAAAAVAVATPSLPQMRRALNSTKRLVAMWREGNYTRATRSDAEYIDGIINSTESWLNASLAEQHGLAATDDPAFTVAQLASRLKRLSRETKLVMNKRPPKSKTKKSKTKKSKTEPTSKTQPDGDGAEAETDANTADDQHKDNDEGTGATEPQTPADDVENEEATQEPEHDEL